MAEIRKKDKNLQIYVSNETYLKFQKMYYNYKGKFKYKSREEFLVLLMTYFGNRNTTELFS